MIIRVIDPVAVKYKFSCNKCYHYVEQSFTPFIHYITFIKIKIILLLNLAKIKIKISQ